MMFIQSTSNMTNSSDSSPIESIGEDMCLNGCCDITFPMRVSTTMMNFFNQVNLGNNTASNPNPRSLHQSLPLLTDHGITTVQILVTLFAIYDRINQLHAKLSHPEVFRQDLFYFYFKETLERLSQIDPTFETYRLNNSDLLHLITLNQRTRSGRVMMGKSFQETLDPPLSSEEATVLQDPEIRRALQEEWSLVQETWRKLRSQKTM
jgi:hypothetical protein